MTNGHKQGGKKPPSGEPLIVPAGTARGSRRRCWLGTLEGLGFERRYDGVGLHLAADEQGGGPPRGGGMAVCLRLSMMIVRLRRRREDEERRQKNVFFGIARRPFRFHNFTKQGR